jgi:hypothetical protein
MFFKWTVYNLLGSKCINFQLLRMNEPPNSSTIFLHYWEQGWSSMLRRYCNLALSSDFQKGIDNKVLICKALSDLIFLSLKKHAAGLVNGPSLIVYHYKKYCHKMRPIRSSSLWTTFKTLSTMAHIILTISIIRSRVIWSGSSCWTVADNTLNYQQRFMFWIASNMWVIGSGLEHEPMPIIWYTINNDLLCESLLIRFFYNGS